MGFTSEMILERLALLAKNEILPQEVEDEIRSQTSQYGKAKLILKNCRYYIETQDRNFLD